MAEHVKERKLAEVSIGPIKSEAAMLGQLAEASTHGGDAAAKAISTMTCVQAMSRALKSGETRETVCVKCIATLEARSLKAHLPQVLDMMLSQMAPSVGPRLLQKKAAG